MNPFKRLLQFGFSISWRFYGKIKGQHKGKSKVIDTQAVTIANKRAKDN